MNPLALIGRSLLEFLATVGRFAGFAIRAAGHCFAPPLYVRQILKQFIDIGYYSLPVVGMTALFTGMVLALQSHSGFSRFDAESAIPTVVVLSITRELGPVLAALMLAGRVSAAIAAEIGAMRATEQIDALKTLSTDPFRYLVAPRLAAAVIVSMARPSTGVSTITLEGVSYRTSAVFTIAGLGVILILIGLYASFW